MTLSLTIGRNAIKICHKEGSRTTVWDVLAEEGEEKLIQTFKDVIAFVEGGQASAAPAIAHWTGDVQGPAVSGGDVPPPAGLANGWAAYAEPKVPEHLAGEIEVIKPGEEA